MSVFEMEKSERILRSAFDLSHEKKFTCDMGVIVPILNIHAVPGDVFEISNSVVCRMQPLLAPILHQIDMETFYFFTPDRIIDPTFEEMITRGITGNSDITPPIWDPADYPSPASVYQLGSLWDFMGFPLIQPPSQACPVDYPRRAYYEVWNQYFRDENLQTAVDWTVPVDTGLKNAAWRKDYFTAALNFAQRGTAPGLPVFGTASVEFDLPPGDMSVEAAGNRGYITVAPNVSYLGWTNAAGGVDNNPVTQVNTYDEILSQNNSVDGSTFTASDINDFRLTAAIQVWRERQARGGARYTETIRKQFGIAPNDARLQRPEFIGATKSHIMISEVLQTSSTDSEPTPQGNLAGHGLGLQSGFAGKYRCEEFGVILGLMVIRPKPAYQDGINRQWLWKSTFDFPWPIFTGIGEQEIYNEEICAIPVADDPTGVENLGIFGYTGRYNEMRYMGDQVCSEMRTTFDYWHLGRQFNPASPPQLNSDFVLCDPRKDIFAVPSVPGFIINFGNRIKALRPIPHMASPSTLGM